MQVGLVENFWVTGTRSRRQQVGWSHPLSSLVTSGGPGLVGEWCRSRMARPKQFCADLSVDVQSTFLERVVGSLPS